MSDSDRLENRLARLRDEIEATGTGRRVLSGSDPEALMALLLREVAETVLQRCLVLETAAPSTVARIEVAAGRVLTLETADGVLSGATDFAEVVDFAVALAAGLRSFLGKETRILIHTETASVAAQPSDLRCPAARIAALLGPRSDGIDSLKAFVAALSHHVLAWRIGEAGGVSDASGGPAGRVADLEAFLAGAGLDARLDHALGGAGRSGCILLGADGEQGERLICARSGRAQLVMLARPSVDPALSESWNALLGG